MPNVLENMNKICPYFIINAETSLITRDQTYNMDVIGWGGTPGGKQAKIAYTTAPGISAIDENKLKGVFVQIRAGVKGVRVVKKVSDAGVGFLKNSEIKCYPGKKQITTNTNTVMYNNIPTLIHQTCLTPIGIAPNSVNKSLNLLTTPATNASIINDHSYIAAGGTIVNRRKSTSVLCSTPDIITIKSENDLVASRSNVTNGFVQLSNYTKPSTNTVGVNTDICLVGNGNQALGQLNPERLRSVGVQVDDTSSDLDEIWNTMSQERIDFQIEQQNNALMSFKLLLFQDLQNCGKFDSVGNLPLHDAVADNNLKLVTRYCTAMKIRRLDINSYNQNERTPLQLAIITKADIEIIHLLIDSYGADVGVTDSNGNSLLHLAILYSEPEIIEIIVRIVGDHICNATNFDGFTPLILSVMDGNVNKTEALLRAQVDPNVCDQKSGRTALFHAIEDNNYQMVTLLLEYNAHTRIKNFFGTSPHDAIFELDSLDKNIKRVILQDKKSRNKCKKRKSPLNMDCIPFASVPKRPGLSLDYAQL